MQILDAQRMTSQDRERIFNQILSTIIQDGSLADKIPLDNMESLGFILCAELGAKYQHMVDIKKLYKEILERERSYTDHSLDSLHNLLLGIDRERLFKVNTPKETYIDLIGLIKAIQDAWTLVVARFSIDEERLTELIEFYKATRIKLHPYSLKKMIELAYMEAKAAHLGFDAEIAYKASLLCWMLAIQHLREKETESIEETFRTLIMSWSVLRKKMPNDVLIAFVMANPPEKFFTENFDSWVSIYGAYVSLLMEKNNAT